MIRTSVRLGVSCALLALAACATAPAKPITPIESTSPKKRIVLIEPYFKLITDKGLFERFHDDWTGSAKLPFAKNLEERLTAKGIELVIPDPAAPADELQPGGELSKPGFEERCSISSGARMDPRSRFSCVSKGNHCAGRQVPLSACA